MPTVFRGHEDNLEDFLTLIQFNLDVNPDKFPTELVKVTYAASFLRETALKWVQPSLRANPRPNFLLNYDLFCKELRRTYGDSSARSQKSHPDGDHGGVRRLLQAIRRGPQPRQLRPGDILLRRS